MSWIKQASAARDVSLALAKTGGGRSPSSKPTLRNVLIGRLRRAAAMLMTAMLLGVAVLMGAHAQGPDELEALTKQAGQLYGQGKYTEAIGVAQQVLTLVEALLGKEHPYTLASVSNLA